MLRKVADDRASEQRMRNRLAASAAPLRVVSAPLALARISRLAARFVRRSFLVRAACGSSSVTDPGAARRHGCSASLRDRGGHGWPSLANSRDGAAAATPAPRRPADPAADAAP